MSFEATVEVFNTDGSSTGEWVLEATYFILWLMCYIGRGIDYVSGPYIVIFPIGVTRALFSVPIIDDDEYEANEYFILTIDPSSLPSNVTIGNPGQVIVTILHNDCKCFPWWIVSICTKLFCKAPKLPLLVS